MNVVVINQVTLDGVRQTPGRPEEDTRGGFLHGGWAAPDVDEVMGPKSGMRQTLTAKDHGALPRMEHRFRPWMVLPAQGFGSPIRHRCISAHAKVIGQTPSTSNRGGCMRRLIYSMSVSLDGFIAGPDGDIDWSAPDEELHRFHNEQVRELGTHLLGRRLYETMLIWETADDSEWTAEYELEFARIWKDLPKIVFSRTLREVQGNARLAANGVAEEVARLKEQPGTDLGVGGASLAADLTRLGLIDEYRLFVSPVVLGGGTPFFPTMDQSLDLELIETRTFGSRVVFLRYRRV